MSFEDVNPIDGRYGYVMISPYFAFPQSDFVPLIDLLGYTLVHHHGGNSYPGQLERHVPNELRGKYSIPQIISLRVLTCHDLKGFIWTTWVSFRLALVIFYERLFLLTSCP